MNSRNVSAANRLVELDVFRGLAALGVLLFHYTTRFDAMFGHPQPLTFAVPYGHYGVQFFFMISGFVIFLTLNRTEHYQDFLVSRFSRLFPVYWMAVVVTYGVVGVLGLPDQERSLWEFVANFTMVHGFFGVEDVDGVYWTLRYELIFYAIMLSLFLLKKLAYIEWICFAWILVQLASHVIEWKFGYFPWKIKQFLLLEFSHLFVAGIVFNRVFVNGFSWSSVALLTLSLLMQYLLDGLVSLIIVSVFFVLFSLFCFDKLALLRVRSLVYLGTISYSLYLIHQNVSYAVFRQLYAYGLPQLAIFFCSFVVVIALAHLLTFYVERPAMRFIRRQYLLRRRLPTQNKLGVAESA